MIVRIKSYTCRSKVKKLKKKLKKGNFYTLSGIFYIYATFVEERRLIIVIYIYKLENRILVHE